MNPVSREVSRAGSRVAGFVLKTQNAAPIRYDVAKQSRNVDRLRKWKMNQGDETQQELDPVCVSSLRELIWIVVAWTVSFAWVIGYCTWRGYDGEPTEFTLVLGMPSWVFWGILLPWVVVTAFTIWFALTQMADHPLDDVVSEADESGVTDHG